jgi:hypothetical protein
VALVHSHEGWEGGRVLPFPPGTGLTPGHGGRRKPPSGFLTRDRIAAKANPGEAGWNVTSPCSAAGLAATRQRYGPLSSAPRSPASRRSPLWEAPASGSGASRRKRGCRPRSRSRKPRRRSPSSASRSGRRSSTSRPQTNGRTPSSSS